MRRVSSLGIFLLIGVLSASHYKISLLPSARRQDPRPSRAEAPGQSASSSLKTVGLSARTETDSAQGRSAVPPRLAVFRKDDLEPDPASDPDYLQPHFFRALSADLPSALLPRPAVLSPRRSLKTAGSLPV